MSIQSPQELLLHELHGIEDAESEASQALEEQMEEVENSKLRKLLERRLKQGERLQKEIKRNLQKLNGESEGRENEAARGLIRDSLRLLQEVETPEMKEAVLIAGVQKLEHYCIAVWGTVRAMAEELGVDDLVQTMERAVEEGYELDEELTKLAEARINPSALEAGEGSDDEEEEEEEDEDEDEDEDDEEDEDEDEDEGEDKDEDKESGSRQQAKSKPSSSRKSSGGGKQAKGRGGESDLKSREYRDQKGEVHHHTRGYMERRGKK
jgi:ferritin-like metal-binding protein YciE